MDKKITVIIGDADSGKTLKAKEIASSYNQENVTWYDGRIFNKKSYRHGMRFYFSRCNLNTELLIIDDLGDASNIEMFYSYACQGLEVEKQGKDPFIIYPKIIIVCSSEVSINDFPLESMAFKRRVSIINCNDGTKGLSD
jgi:type II secretory pathway predicted ATPase ExeA